MKLQSVLLVAPSCFALALSADAWQSTELISVSALGVQGNHESWGPPRFSDDGRFVAFHSSASTLVSGDINNFLDVFVRDRLMNTVERVSVDSAGGPANGPCYGAWMSADGRFVAFTSTATNLVAGDTNGSNDAFVHDRMTGITERVSVNSAGVQGNDNTYCSSISADGRYVAMLSNATNLVHGDTNGKTDCFVRDRLNGTTERVSVSSSGAQANFESSWCTLSADGRFAAFGSRASNLVAGDTNGAWDFFRHDLQTGETLRVNVSSSGGQGDLGGYGDSIPALSADGRFVAFATSDTNLVAGDTNGSVDIYVRDVLGGTTERASVDSSGLGGAGHSELPTLSADGRYVAFQSDAALVAGDTNGVKDIYLRDRLAGITELVSFGAGGVQSNGRSLRPCLSVDGRLVGFESVATNLIAGDLNDQQDVFLRDRGAAPVVSFCTPGQANAIGCPCSNPPSGTGRGCDNSAATGGASIGASGSASLTADTLVFTTAGENPTATSIVVQGSSASFEGFAFGQGVRCVTGSLKRLYVKSASGGGIVAPSGSDPAISGRSAALGDAILAGEHRYYMVQYRDSIVLGGCPSTSTFNATDAIDVPWQP